MSSFSVMFYIVLLILIALVSSASLRPVARDSSLGECPVKPAVITCGKMCKTKIVVDPTEEDYGDILTKALKKAAKDKCTLYLNAGTYPVKTAIVMPSESCLQGAGRFLTKIVARNSAKDTKNDGIIRISNRDHVSIAGIYVDSTKCKQNNFCKYSIKIKDSTDIKLYYSALDGAHSDGIYAHDSERLHVDGLFIGSCGHNCFAFRKSKDVLISRSMAARCGRHGYSAADGSSRLRLEASFSMDTGNEDSHGCGFHFDGSTGEECASISDTHIVGAEKAGVCSSKIFKLFVSDSSISSTKSDYCFQTHGIDDGLEVTNVSCDSDIDDLFKKSNEDPEKVCTGIKDKNSDACCPAECKECKSDGCEDRYNGRSCCPRLIDDSNKDWVKKSCLFNPPPCVVGKAPLKSD